MTSPTPFSEQTQHDKDSGGNAGRDISKETGSEPGVSGSPSVPNGLTGRLSYGEKLLARIEGLYASKTVHLAPEPEGGRHGIIGVDGMDMGATQPSPYLKTAILGDSMAAACGVENQSEGLMPRIAHGIAQRVNRPVSWETYGRLGATMRRVRFREFPEVAGTDYDIMYICAGSNDLMAQRSTAEWREDLLAVIRQAKEKAKAVVILRPGQLYNSPSLGRALRKAMLIASDRQTAESERICKAQGVTYLNLTHVEVNADVPEFYAYDHFHPGKQGYQIIADYVTEHTPLSSII